MRNVESRSRRSGRGCLPWVGRIILGLIALLAILVLAGQVARARTSQWLSTETSSPGHLVDIGGYRLHLYCRGRGEPTVIFEAAIGSPGSTWSLVQPQVARETRACVYDRAGLGWSEISPQPRRVDVMNAELHSLLSTEGIPGPYVLVGYSSGGWTARMYAHSYPEQIAGMVMVDSAHEDQARRLGAQGIPAANWIFEIGPLVIRSGIPALYPRMMPLPGKGYLPEEELHAYQALMVSQDRFIETMVAELVEVNTNMERVRAAQITSLGDIPLIVLAHTNLEVIPGVRLSPEAGDIWLELQSELAALSPQGRVITTQESGHDILFEQPQLVIDAILEVVAAAR